ncbi:MAG: calcium-translocating P-type ATPase, PMCA-type [Clostridia bacterium]|nr:calcium-translocating P-type ATPase, PMCA-type [Clostridia bacterium]
MNETIRIVSGRQIRRKTDAPPEKIPVPSFSTGLTAEEAEKSRQLYGSNTMTAKKQAGFFTQFLSNLNDPIIKILIAALLINIIFTFTHINWAETIGIGLTVLISAAVTTVSEHSSGASFEKLYGQLGDSMVRVIRSGTEISCSASELVKYDVVLLFPGDTVPADGIMLRGSVGCDESPLTGESRTVEKQPDPQMLAQLYRTGSAEAKTGPGGYLLRGSHAASGSGVMLVLAVGDSTMYGGIASELADVNAVSPLKDRLTKLAGTISKIGYASAILVAAVHLADAFWFDAGMNPSIALARMKDLRYLFRELIQALTLAISVVVVAVPEGLPMMITVVLSSNMKRMMKSGVLVRRLVGIETAGNVDILFTDKTGTLTTGNLTVASFITADSGYRTWKECPADLKKNLQNSARACTSVHNSTEEAINRFCKIPRIPDPVREQIPFDSARKFSAGVVDDRLYIRGASEYLLPSCTHLRKSDGTEVPLSAEKTRMIRETISEYAAKSYRILLCAEGKRELFLHLTESLPTSGLVLTGLFVIRDEVRQEAASAVRTCREAGIQVVMLTGDNSETAAGIAVECGILPEHHTVYMPGDSVNSLLQRKLPLVLDGPCLRSASDDEVTALLPLIRVISRVTPADKSRLIRIAKASSHITGMTGDGINDAPALKAADVGFAMGSGTDVAREAGDIVITDDNFSSITQAILFGRTIFSSIRKFITFQLTMNLAAVGVSVLGTIFGIEHPVTVIQMLWVNIIMDTLGSLAFAGEPALPDCMKQTPVKRDEPILTGAMTCQILLTGGYAVVMAMYFLLSPQIRHWFGGGEVYHLTLFFALFIFMGIGIALCTRTPRLNPFSNIGRNTAFLVIMPAVALIQLIIIYFGGDVFRCIPLEADDLAVCAVFALTVIPADTIRKAVVRLLRKK